MYSSNDNSRRSSHTASIKSRRRRSSAASAILRQGTSTLRHRRSADVTSGKSSRSFALPGIEISRIDTMDFDDASIFSSGTGGLRLGGGEAVGRGRQRFIVIHSDASSDISRFSYPSEYSLSATSRSRSSRASSNVSSRLWDFSSPRESDWDVAGGGSVSRPDLRAGRDYSLLSPAMPRKGSVVTFDISEPTVRRHSSPAPSLRRKDSVIDTGGACSSSSSASEAAATTGMKTSDSRDTLTTAAGNPTLNHRVLEKRNSSRSRRSEQSPLLSVVDEDCRAGSSVAQPSRLPKSASDIKPTFGSTGLSVDRLRSSLDSAARASSSACRSALKRNNTGGNLIEAQQRPIAVNHFQSSLAVESETDRFPAPMSSASRDSSSATNGLLSVTATRPANDAETQTPPSVRDFRRSLIDYSNTLSPFTR